MLDLLIPISDDDFLELIEYLKIKCNIISFRIPHFDKRIITKDNFPQHRLRPSFENVGDVMLVDSSDKLFKHYKENVGDLLLSLKNSIIDTFLSEKYIDQVYCHENEVYFLKFDDTVYEMLKSHPNLYAWRCPNYPEDISFWVDDFCLCQTISHEEMCFLEDDDIFFQRFYRQLTNQGPDL